MAKVGQDKNIVTMLRDVRTFDRDFLMAQLEYPEHRLIGSEIEVTQHFNHEFQRKVYTFVRDFIHDKPHIEIATEKESLETDPIWIPWNRWHQFMDAVFPRWFGWLQGMLRYKKITTTRNNTVNHIKKIYNICPHFSASSREGHIKFLTADPLNTYNRNGGRAEYMVVISDRFETRIDRMPDYESALSYCKHTEGAYVVMKLVESEQLKGEI